jgi:hypothetical protein
LLLSPAAAGGFTAGWLGYLGTDGHKMNKATTNKDSTINCGLNWANLPPRPGLWVWLGSMALLMLLLSSLPALSTKYAYGNNPDTVERYGFASQMADQQHEKQLVAAEATVDAVSCNSSAPH